VQGSDDWEAKVAEYDEVISDLPEAATLLDRDRLAWALGSRGWALLKLSRAREALASYDEVVARFDDAPEVELRVHVALALEGRASAFLGLKRPDEALAVCDDMLSRYTDVSDERFASSISFALLTRGAALWRLGRNWEAAETYQKHLQQFSPPSLVALFGLARSSSAVGRHEEAIAAIDAYLNAVAEASEPVDAWWIAFFLRAKARHLIVLGKLREALVPCEQAVDLFRGTSEPALRESLAGMLLRKAAILALDEESDAAAAALDEALALRTEDDEMLLVDFEPDELEELKQGLARLSDDPAGYESDPDLLWQRDGEQAYGIKVVDLRNLADDLRDLD
jgi:tetratricopeptide (TPR) repeat protein